MTIKEILEQYGVYSEPFEADLLRHFAWAIDRVLMAATPDALQETAK